MRHSLLVSLLSFCLLSAAARPAPALTLPHLCLPPVYEGGQRLHIPPVPDVQWLELLLRQHEVCWRRPPHDHEIRVFLYGNSGVFGFPLPVEETVGADLNELLLRAHLSAHVFNLAFVYASQLKDALIINESLRFRPDVIVYALTLPDLSPMAAQLWLPLIRFFERNRSELLRLAAQQPEGLTERLRNYVSWFNSEAEPEGADDRLREIGTFVRTGVRLHAQSIRRRLDPDFSVPIKVAGRQRTYNCAQTKRKASEDFLDWQQGTILAYLEQVGRILHIPVVIVNWPVAYEPVADCYNVRFPTTLFQEYNRWVASETQRRHLHLLDLHDLLTADDFVDSIHVTAIGQRKIADALAPMLDTVVRERAASQKRPLQ